MLQNFSIQRHHKDISVSSFISFFQPNSTRLRFSTIEHGSWRIDTPVTLPAGARETTTTETDTAETTATATVNEIETTTVTVVGEVEGAGEMIETETADDIGPGPETGVIVTATATAGAHAPRFAIEMDTISATTGPETEAEEAGATALETLAAIGMMRIGMALANRTEVRLATGIILVAALTPIGLLTPQKTGETPRETEISAAQPRHPESQNHTRNHQQALHKQQQHMTITIFR